MTDSREAELLRKTAREVFGSPQATLATLGDLGWLGFLAPEVAGGAGWFPIEAGIVCEEAGRAGTAVPYLDALLAASLCSHSPEGAVDGELVAGLVGGRRTCGLGYGRVTQRGGEALRLWGQMRGAAGGSGPRLLVVVDEEADGAYLLDPWDGAMTLQRDERSLDTSRDPWSGVVEGAPSVALEVDTNPVGSLLVDIGRALVAADSLGALSAARERLVEYLSQRMAFGGPIAANQVVAHRLVDLYLVESKLRTLVEVALATAGAMDPDTARAALAAYAYAGQHVTAALDDCVQLSGGIGFTWEYPLHHEMRRAFANSVLLGSTDKAKGRLIRLWLESPGAHDGLRHGVGWPKGEGEERAGFRSQVRDFIEENRPRELIREGHRAPTNEEQERQLRQWFAKLYAGGLLGADWPPEYGGVEVDDAWRHRMVAEELLLARAPRPVDQVQLATSMLLRFGTEDQKTRYLAKIRSAEHIWCQLLSEPDAGSDIAAVRTKGDCLEDGSIRVSGQKTWITDGHWADMGLALIRTEAGSQRHRGLSTVLISMKAPGVTVRPIRTISDVVEINEVFLEDVLVPASDVLGAVGSGWTVIMKGLDGERLGIGGNVLLLDQLLDDLRTLVMHLELDGRPAYEVGQVTTGIAGLVLEANAAWALVERQFAQIAAGEDDSGSSAAAKVSFSECYHRIAAYAAGLGAAGTLDGDPDADGALERLNDCWLWSRAYTISGGSSEMMRNILAKRTLGLPSARRSA